MQPSRVRILDIGGDLAPAATRLLVGLGADVVRIAVDREPADSAALADQLHWYSGVQLIAAATAEEKRAIADRLAPEADIVIESGPARELVGVDIHGSKPRSRWPSTVHVVVTPFGLTGPRRDWLGSDLVIAAAGGSAYLGGRPDGPPKPPPGEQALQLAGTHAAIAALLGLLVHDRTGGGQLVDISAQEAVAATLETAAISWIHAGRFPRRTGGVYEHVAHRIFAARDGYVAGGYSGSSRMWTDLLAWLADENAAEDLTDPKWADAAIRWAHRAHVDDVVARFVASRRAHDIAEEGRRRALPWAQVVTPAQLPDNPQLTHRDFFVTITDDRLPDGKITDVGFPFAAPAVPRPTHLKGPRPTSGGSPWRSTRRGSQPPPGTGDQPLAGIRVLDLTWVLAGPYATKTLADFGAEVIKIESIHRQDPTRVAPGMRLRPGAGSDDSGYFINFNRNKHSIALNLRTDEGVELLRQIAAQCDVLVENFSPGMLERWGLTYPELARRRPGTIVVSMAGTGQTGPWRDAVTFADTLAAMSGLSWQTREPGGPPQGLTFGLGDMVAANAAILAILERVIAGEGGYVDLSQLESMAAALGPAIVQAQLGVPEPPATAEHPSRHLRFCPHGLYPAAGSDRWIAITALDEQMWLALADLCPPLHRWRDASVAARREDEDEIDAIVAKWTARQDGAELASRLQDAGVAAASVNTGADLVDSDEQLAARQFYVTANHAIAGPVLHEGVVERLAVGGARIADSAPLLGEHTDELLCKLAGVDESQIAQLRDKGVLE